MPLIIEEINRMRSIMGLDEIDVTEPGPYVDKPFDLNTFINLKSFSKRVNYCNETLQKIGSGSSRVVYKINNFQVLKLAKNEKGVAQNEAEADYNVQYHEEMVTKVFESDDKNLWIVSELALPVKKGDFKRLAGVDFDLFSRYAKDYEDRMRGRHSRYINYGITPEIADIMMDNEWVSNLITFLEEADMQFGDYVRLSTYGRVNRNGKETLVVVDAGSTNDNISTYYS
jgi:hypothetical protein